MPWREHYRTKVLVDLSYPVCELATLDGSRPPQDSLVLVGGFGFGAMQEQGTWWRLFQSDFPQDPQVYWAFVLSIVERPDFELALACVPPSQGSRTLLISDPHGRWAEALQPESLHMGFACVVQGATMPVAMVGSATEDAWDEFCRYWPVRT